MGAFSDRFQLPSEEQPSACHPPGRAAFRCRQTESRRAQQAQAAGVRCQAGRIHNRERVVPRTEADQTTGKRLCSKEAAFAFLSPGSGLLQPFRAGNERELHTKADHRSQFGDMELLYFRNVSAARRSQRFTPSSPVAFAYTTVLSV
jgi:hypothetical protein